MTNEDYQAGQPEPEEAPKPAGSRFASQCKATSKTTGNRCGAPSIPGGAVCRHHGGAAPQVKRKAALRLLELIDPAITTLAREMMTADKSADRQRAANSLLDRAGVPRSTTSPDSEAAKDLLVERLKQIRAQQEKQYLTIEAAEVIDNTEESTDEG